MKVKTILAIRESLNQSLRIAQRDFDEKRKQHLSIVMSDPLKPYKKSTDVPFRQSEIELSRRVSYLKEIIKEFDEYDWR